MLIPRKVKFRKQFRGKMKGISSRGHHLIFGSFGLKAMSRRWLTSRQIEAARRAITRHIKRQGQVWIRVFPDKPVTSQPNETGMGGGKGAVDHYVCVITPGRIIFELDGVERDVAHRALALAGYKLPFKTKVITKTK